VDEAAGAGRTSLRILGFPLAECASGGSGGFTTRICFRQWGFDDIGASSKRSKKRVCRHRR